MSTVPELERMVLFRSGSCNFTSLAEDFTYEGVNYEPGILIPGEHSASVDGRLAFIPKACEDLITDRNLGDSVYLFMIQRDVNSYPDWYTTSSHWYILGEVRNIGKSQWEVRLLHPKALLNKGEQIQWSDEFTRRKYNGDEWFSELSNIKEKTVKIVID